MHEKAVSFPKWEEKMMAVAGTEDGQALASWVVPLTLPLHTLPMTTTQEIQQSLKWQRPNFKSLTYFAV